MSIEDSKVFRRLSELLPSNETGEKEQEEPRMEVPEVELDEGEVLRRLPEIELIEDDELRERLINFTIVACPDYFWYAPAASWQGYHNLYATLPRGLWIHTKMVCTAYMRMVDSYVQNERVDFTDVDKDLGLAACILHDMDKMGIEGWDIGESAAKDHDITMAEKIRISDLPNGISEDVLTHMGAWYEGPPPTSHKPRGMLVHMADMVGSTNNITCGMYKPADEIVNHYPNMPQATFENDEGESYFIYNE